jgi:transcriptional regulator with XRE-family HTH domain
VTEGKQEMVDVADLGELVRRRRAAERLTLRQVEEQLHGAITASSLSRLEHGAIPHPKNVPALAAWLELPVELIAWPGQAHQQATTLDTPTVVEIHLRADRNLESGAAATLSAVFRHLYEGLAEGKFTVPIEGHQTKD